MEQSWGNHNWGPFSLISMSPELWHNQMPNEVLVDSGFHFVQLHFLSPPKPIPFRKDSRINYSPIHNHHNHRNSLWIPQDNQQTILSHLRTNTFLPFSVWSVREKALSKLHRYRPYSSLGRESWRSFCTDVYRSNWERLDLLRCC